MSTEIDSLLISIESNAESAAGGIDKLTVSMQKLKASAKLTTVHNNLTKLNEGIAALNGSLADGDGNLDKFADGLDSFKDKANGAANAATKANKQTKALAQSAAFGAKMFSKLISGISLIVGGQALASAFTGGLSDALAWDSIAMRFDKGFGDQAQETADYIDKMTESMSINKQEFMQYAGIFASLANGFGVAEDQVADLSIGLTQLAYDLYAYEEDFYSYEEAMRAVKSAITGELESIRNAGLSISAAMLQETAARHGITQSVDTMTESQKALLRYTTMVEQATQNGMIGAWAAELNTAQGQIRALAQQLKGLGQSLGGVLIPLLNKVIPFFRALVEIINDAIVAVASFFGIELQAMDWSQTEDGQSSFENLGGSIDDTTESLKKLKSYTLGIDELNVINPNSGGGSGSGVGGSGWSLEVNRLWDESMFEQANQQMEEMKTKVKQLMPLIVGIAAAFAAWKIAGLFGKSLKVLTKPEIAAAFFFIASGLTFIVQGVKDFIQNGATFDNFVYIATGIMLIAAAIALLTGNIKTGLIAGGIMLAIVALTMLSDEILGAVSWFIAAVGEGAKFLGNVIAAGYAVFGNIIVFIVKVLSGAWNALKTFVGNLIVGMSNGILDLQIAFTDFAINVISKIKSIAETANSLLGIFGLHIETTGLENALTNLAKTREELGASKLEKSSLSDAWNEGFNAIGYIDIGYAFNTYDAFAEGRLQEAYQTGAAVGTGFQDKLRELLDSNHGELVANSNTGSFGNREATTSHYGEELVSYLESASRQMNNSQQAVNVYLDGKQITASVEQHQKNRGATILGREVYAY